MCMSLVNLFLKRSDDKITTIKPIEVIENETNENLYEIEGKILTRKEKHAFDGDKVLFSCDENKINYSQRNNKYYKKIGENVANAHTMCNVTSMCMALDYAGYKFPDLGKWSQPEDALMDFMVTNEEIDALYKKNYPTYYDAYKKGIEGAYYPNEVHSILSYGTNLWMGVKPGKITQFISNANFPYLLYLSFVKGSVPIVVSGSFPTSSGDRLNHIVTVSGVAYTRASYDKYKKSGDWKDLLVENVKIDDPYGNTLTGWSGSGQDILLTWEYCVNNLKPLNSASEKWCHTFVPGPEII